MIIVVKRSTSEIVLEDLKARLRNEGFDFDCLTGKKYFLFPVIGDFTKNDISRFKSIPGVLKVLRVSSPYYFVTKEYKEKTVIDLGDNIKVGEGFTFMAGPCSIEDEDSLYKIASNLSDTGVNILRGGAFKLRSSPYSFQGMGLEGLRILKKIADNFFMKTISEISDIRHLDEFLEHVDIIQVGARNMFNFPLLRELGKTEKPIMLKRAPSAKIEDFLLSAEHILSAGNSNVILCERGTVTFDDSTRNSINMAHLPILKDMSHLPVFLDPSHGVGLAKYVPAVSEASIVLGVDGLLIETHNDPSVALSDGYQSISLEVFSEIYKNVGKLLTFLNFDQSTNK